MQISTIAVLCLGGLLQVLFLRPCATIDTSIVTSIVSNSNKADHKQTIFLGLALDERSLSDAILLIHSALQTARQPQRLHFLVLACGHDEIAASHLRRSIEQHLQEVDAAPLNNVYSGGWAAQKLTFTVRAFTLPADSGFGAQLEASTLQQQQVKGQQRRPSHSHWNSQSGADFARFFLPTVFADIVTTATSDRILYLDNDIIVACCLEEIFFSELSANSVAGVVLDDLKWATATQFQRHYNASHPLVVQHMRHGHLHSNNTHFNLLQQSIGGDLEQKEFLSKVPKYPNDGVLLWHVSRFNEQQVFRDLDKIAQANAESFVVNLGTQQFTVLTLHDRWTELTPRANLRHFPDMARGFLMWFYYHGLLHFAGQHKPAGLCPVDNHLAPFSHVQRMASLTPWLIALQDLYNRRHLKQDLAALCLRQSDIAQPADTARPVNTDKFIGWKMFCEENRHTLHLPEKLFLRNHTITNVGTNINSDGVIGASSTNRQKAHHTLFGGDLASNSNNINDNANMVDETRVSYLRHSLSIYTKSVNSDVDKKVEVAQCLSMVATAPTFAAFAQLLTTLANGKKEENLVYLRLGDLSTPQSTSLVFPYVGIKMSHNNDNENKHGDSHDNSMTDGRWSGSATQRHLHWTQRVAALSETQRTTFYATHLLGHIAALHTKVQNNTNISSNTRAADEDAEDWLPRDSDLLRIVDDIASVGHASWSLVNFLLPPLDQNTFDNSTKSNSNERRNTNSAPTHALIVQEKLLRDYRAVIGDSYFLPTNNNNANSNSNSNSNKKRYHYAKASVTRSLDVFASSQPPLCAKEDWRDFRSAALPTDCRDVLVTLRTMQRKHWEVILLAAQTSQISSESASTEENIDIQNTQTAGQTLPKSAAAASIWQLLRHLAALDMHFMRPPLVFLTLSVGHTHHQQDNDRDNHGLGLTKEVEAAVLEVRDWLRSQGYLLGVRRHSEALYLWGVRMNHAEVGTAMQQMSEVAAAAAKLAQHKNGH